MTFLFTNPVGDGGASAMCLVDEAIEELYFPFLFLGPGPTECRFRAA